MKDIKDIKDDFAELIQKRSDDTILELKRLFQSPRNPDNIILFWLYVAGAVCIVLPFGAMSGFVFAYKKLNFVDRQIPPTLSNQPRIIYICMFAGAIIALLLPLFLLFLAAMIDGTKFGVFVTAIISYASVNLFFTFIVMLSFKSWQAGVYSYLISMNSHGSSRFAEFGELREFWPKPAGGIYIGEGLCYPKSGHILTVAGTRAGKGVNLIVPNFLAGVGQFKGSWVVLDPKGEIAAITTKAQERMGRNVVYLNPWEMLGMESTVFNPLDLLKDDRMNLSDDVQMIAETIVPYQADDSGASAHFTNKSRSMIEGLILHLVTSKDIPKEKKNLATLWEWLRLSTKDWLALVKAMKENDSPNGGDIVKAFALEILQLMDIGDKEYSGIVSGAQKWTDFLKSPAIRNSIADILEEQDNKETKQASTEVKQQEDAKEWKTAKKAFSSQDLADGNTTVYVIIPADRLKTHYQWLRLVVCSLMRSVIRSPKKDVCFLLDECYALGYLSEIDVALGSYAGYGVHVWAIFQNLVQIKKLYGENWENFISSCSVRHFFNVSDNTSAEYISKFFGERTYPNYNALGNITGVIGRNLVNPDELRRFSSEIIYTIIEHHHPFKAMKLPYYKMHLKEGVDYDKNPYIKD